MNDEIKLWKEKTKGIFHITEYTRFWNYITNLQQQLHQASLDIQELTERDIECPSWCDKLTYLQQEIKHISKVRDEIIEKYNDLQQENERLKEVNKVLEENWKHYMMRCGKAIEYIKENATSNYFDGKINMFRREIDLLNILQNGSEDNEKIY